jgi:hypothetical protein
MAGTIDDHNTSLPAPGRQADQAPIRAWLFHRVHMLVSRVDRLALKPDEWLVRQLKGGHIRSWADRLRISDFYGYRDEPGGWLQPQFWNQLLSLSLETDSARYQVYGPGFIDIRVGREEVEAFGIALVVEDLLKLVPEIKNFPRRQPPAPAPLEPQKSPPPAPLEPKATPEPLPPKSEKKNRVSKTPSRGWLMDRFRNFPCPKGTMQKEYLEGVYNALMADPTVKDCSPKNVLNRYLEHLSSPAPKPSRK